MVIAGLQNKRAPECSDAEIIARVLAGDAPAYEALMRRYNTRIYRIVCSILRDDAEAEDVMQETYIRAYQHLSQFEGRSTFATWLGHIAVHEALARSEKAKRREFRDLEATGADIVANDLTPEEQSASQETRSLLERAILKLQPKYRSVLMLRDVEEMSTAEVAATLNLTEEAVKVRLFRARAQVRKALFLMVGATSSEAFQFHASRCDRVAANVLKVICSA